MNEKSQFSLLEKRLRSSRPHFGPRADFTGRVMDNLPARAGLRDKRNTANAKLPFLRVFLGFAAAACIALIVLQMLPRDAHIAEAPALAEENLQAPTAVKIPEISAAQVGALTARLDEPLETELKNVISDTRQAIQFVASNFIPENQNR